MPSHPQASSVRPPRPLRWILSTLAIFSAAVLAAVLATAGSYAFWNDSAAIAAPMITAGSTAITINGDPANHVMTPSLDVSKLLPGRSVVSQPLIVKNTGTTPVSVTPGNVAFAGTDPVLSNSLSVVVRQNTTCNVTPFGTAPVSFSTPIVLLSGQSSTVCVEVRLSTDAPASVQSNTANFAVTLDAKQVRLP